MGKVPRKRYTTELEAKVVDAPEHPSATCPGARVRNGIDGRLTVRKWTALQKC